MSQGKATMAEQPAQASGGAYNSKEVEAKWTEYWFENDLFATSIDPDRPNFSCALPPPNITGNLHMGHALNGTIQDVLTRWKRMQGYNVLWQPGTDHAGISTQMVVERELKKQGINRHQLGREEFIKRCWVWREQYGNNILSQYKRLGVSFSWDRMKFTLDPDYVRAIYRAFRLLFDEGKIYRGNRVTNWCPRCQTSLSDLEVEHEETNGSLYEIKYPLTKESGGAGDAQGTGIVVATTRPETMFGDVAVAVNPKDPRHKKYVGKSVVLPLTGRILPVIADDYVETEFGTGALKITPAHDANDWEIGQRHKLPSPVVIDKQGKLFDNEYVPAQFQGIERFAARKAVVDELTEKGYMQLVKDYSHGVGYCERCHTVIEPYLSDQWYLKMEELAQPAIEVVEANKVQFIPERYASTYLDWMRNVRDWNISRQLWWGHRIPIFTCENAHVHAYEETPTKCQECDSQQLTQDEDVLDTWFSSSLWPFATLGWPNANPMLKTFYPTSILSTAREIINLWVSRMIFTGIKFAGTIPFKQVLIHPVIQTHDGKRMSKSKGNAVDPIDMIEKYGADANRYWFASVGLKGDQDVRFREDKLEEYKHFANKLWNAGKLVVDKLKDYTPQAVDPAHCTLADRWILHRYTLLLQGLQDQLQNYDFTEAAQALYTFVWDYFCDWYLEISKQELANASENSQTQNVLYYVFEGVLRALHPITPFITEDIWERLPHSQFMNDMESIMFAPYPRADQRFIDETAEGKMDLIMKTIRAIRNIRQTFNVDLKAEAAVLIACADKSELETLEQGRRYITGDRSARVAPLTIAAKLDEAELKMAATAVVSQVRLFVPLAALIDVTKTRAKLLLQQEAALKEINKLKGTLDNPDFRKRAPADKVAIQELALAEAQAKMDTILGQLKLLEG
jgi:valyl-tRNA synthetase